MITALVTGSAGMVGSWLVRTAPPGVKVHGTTRAEVDLTDRDAVLGLFATVAPDVVIHTAYRPDELELDVVLASGNVIDACLATNAGLVHLSTDVVFSGTHGPYGEHDRPDPISPYGQAKAAVEADLAARLPDAAVVRTSLVCWNDPPDPRTEAVLESLRSGRPASLYVDELRSPVRADDLAAALWEIALLPARSRSGYWHLVVPEGLSRYTLGVLIAAWAGLDPDVLVPAWNADSAEPRPRDTRLTSRATEIALATPMRPVSTLFARWPTPRRKGRRTG